MKSFLVIATVCSLLQHLLLGCCWHHEACAHQPVNEHACHADHAEVAKSHAHGESQPVPSDEHDSCSEGRCWWLADHASPQPPLLERLSVAELAAEPLPPTRMVATAWAEHLPHGMALHALPVRAHLWNQLFLI